MEKILTVLFNQHWTEKLLSPSLRSKREKQRSNIWGLLPLSFQRYSQTPTCLLPAPRPLYTWQTNRSRGHPASPCICSCSHTHMHAGTHREAMARFCNTFKHSHKDSSSPKTEKSLKLNTVSQTHTQSLMYRQTKGGLSSCKENINLVPLWGRINPASYESACARVRVHVCVHVCCNLSFRITTRGWEYIATIDDCWQLPEGRQGR